MEEKEKICEKCLEIIIESVRRTDDFEEFQCPDCKRIKNNAGRPRWDK